MAVEIGIRSDMRAPAFGTPRAAPYYEVDDSLGRCIYRGTDVELAHEIYAADPHAHLLPLTRAECASAGLRRASA